MFSIGSFTAGTLLGIFIGAFTNHLLAKSRSSVEFERQNFNTASEELRNAFATELIALRPHNADESDAFTFLKSAFQKHEKAIYIFKTYLDSAKQKEFEQAWYDYGLGTYISL